MSVQLLLLASLPALGWGLMPIVSKLMGGKSEEQLLGTTIAALIFGSVFGFLNQVSYAMVPFFISLLSGVFWACGQYFQFLALEKAEVSKVMPVSVGTQLLFVTLASGFFLKEWTDLTTVIFSIMALGVILTGVFLVTKTTHQQTGLTQQVLLYLCCSSAFLMLYVTVTGLFQISGAQSFLPQAVGMFLGGSVISLKSKQQLRFRKIIHNLGTGSTWVIANTSLFAVSSSLGVGVTYSFSQMSLLVATYGSIILLKEQKVGREKQFVALGSLLYIVGVLGMSWLK
jgi:glucose uptake protein